MIAKNRDAGPDESNVLKLVTPGRGFRYFGLFAEKEGKSNLRAGFNERGLVIVPAASPFTEEQLRSMRTRGAMQTVLSRGTSVKKALALAQEMSPLTPAFLVMADKRQIGCMEIGPNGRNAASRTKSGVMFHTNHYLASELAGFNFFPLDPWRSTVARLERIKEFLAEKTAYELSDFIRMSQSREGGPKNSIWRDGREPTATRTVASWIVWQPGSGPAKIFVRLANPGEEMRDVYVAWRSEGDRPGYLGNPVTVKFHRAERLYPKSSVDTRTTVNEAESHYRYEETVLASDTDEGDFEEPLEMTQQ